MADIEGPVFLKPMQAAQLLGFSRSKIYDALATGAIRSTRIAGCLRIPRAAIDRLVKEAMSVGDAARNE